MTSPEERPTIVDALADLLQLGSDWVRQEADAVMHDKIVIPLQKLGLTLASAGASGCAMLMGLVFIAVAVFMFLGGWIGYPFAFLIVGLVYVFVSAVFLVVKVRMMQK